MQVCKHASMQVCKYASILIKAKRYICPQLRHFFFNITKLSQHLIWALKALVIPSDGLQPPYGLFIKLFSNFSFSIQKQYTKQFTKATYFLFSTFFIRYPSLFSLKLSVYKQYHSEQIQLSTNMGLTTPGFKPPFMAFSDFHGLLLWPLTN